MTQPQPIKIIHLKCRKCQSRYRIISGAKGFDELKKDGCEDCGEDFEDNFIIEDVE